LTNNTTFGRPHILTLKVEDYTHGNASIYIIIPLIDLKPKVINGMKNLVENYSFSCFESGVTTIRPFRDIEEILVDIK